MASVLANLFPKLGSLGTSDHASVVSINLFVALLCACIIIGHLLEENRWVNESITALIIVSITPFILHMGFPWKTCNAACVKINKIEVKDPCRLWMRFYFEFDPNCQFAIYIYYILWFVYNAYIYFHVW